MESEFIVNPITGRKLRVGSAAYMKLMRDLDKVNSANEDLTGQGVKLKKVSKEPITVKVYSHDDEDEYASSANEDNVNNIIAHYNKSKNEPVPKQKKAEKEPEQKPEPEKEKEPEPKQEQEPEKEESEESSEYYTESESEPEPEREQYIESSESDTDEELLDLIDSFM